jgi:hypothetical protein
MTHRDKMNNFKSTSDYAHIINDFPNLELSYETTVHNKVQCDYMCAIPMGKKYFAWFTTYKNNSVCFIMEICSQSKKIISITPTLTSFHDSLSIGTIAYGTIFKYNGTQFFCLEDIFYYKGRKCDSDTHFFKLKTFKHLLEYEIGKYAFNDSCLLFGLPIYNTCFKTLINCLDQCPYKIYSIQFHKSNKIFKLRYSEVDDQMINDHTIHNNDKPKGYNNDKPKFHNSNANSNTSNNKINNKMNNKIKIFRVVADIQPDIYYLHDIEKTYNDGKKEEVAYIPNYTTSVMMNKLFRNIKENDNLDALEESDDEDEFENSNVDKFVFLDKSYNMSCVYNNKFKKWTPQKIVDK